MAPVSVAQGHETYALKNARRRKQELLQCLRLFLKDYLRYRQRASEDQCFIQKLPVEVLDKIVRELPITDKLNVRLVNNKMSDTASCSIKFCPILDRYTLDSFKSFLNHPTRKYYKELNLGDLRDVDYYWLEPSHLAPIQTLRFGCQFLHQSLKPAFWFIKQSTNLRELEFKEYNFTQFNLAQLAEDEEIAVICNQLTHLAIKGIERFYCSLCEANKEVDNNVVPTSIQVHTHVTIFNCDYLTTFNSLQSLVLLKMRHVHFRKIASLPVTLKHLQLSTVVIRRPELALLIERLVNLERLLIQSDSLDLPFGVAMIFPEDELDLVVPLNKSIFETMILHRNIKFLHYIPILPATTKRLVASTSLTGSNIVDFKFTAVKQTLTAIIKRQAGYKRK